MNRAFRGGFSSIAITAALSVLLLVGAIVWKIEGRPNVAANNQAAPTVAQTNNGTPLDATTSSDIQLTPLGTQVLDQVASAYSDATKDGPLNEKSAQQAAQTVLANTHSRVSYTQFSTADIKTTTDISKDSVARYRQALQVTLKPLLGITEPEFATFGRYVQSKDPSALTQLQADADAYRSALAASTQVTVPQTAVTQHIAILNAMSEFAATLDALQQNSHDPFASSILLTNYNQAESDMVSSFNSLAMYYRTSIGSTSTTATL